MPSVCYGTPNLYFLFWAMGIHNLKQDSELVYIVPRSWTSGAYFKRFRQYLFKHCVITDMHLFESRDKVFDGESVLQETIIIKVKKTKRIPDYVSITSSSTSSFEDIVHFCAPYETVVAQSGRQTGRTLDDPVGTVPRSLFLRRCAAIPQSAETAAGLCRRPRVA